MAIRLDLPGADLIERGLEDLANARNTAAAMLVQIGRPRLTALGIEVAEGAPDPEHRLYDLLVTEFGPDDAHSRYNALIRELVSFERAAECVA